MQTFLPYSNYEQSAKCLDVRRLNKQIVEVDQIIRAINDLSYGWQNHPAVNMWRNYRCELLAYGLAMYDEWQRRFNDGERGGRLLHVSGERIRGYGNPSSAFPHWLGDERLHSSHRACLKAKSEHYQQFGWVELPTPPVSGRWPYWWPSL